jgi:hypothetical protein
MKITWEPVRGMEPSGPWCDGIAYINGISYVCDVVTQEQYEADIDDEDWPGFGYGHYLVVPNGIGGPLYFRGSGDDNELYIVVPEDWDAKSIPGHISTLTGFMLRGDRRPTR